MAFLQIRVLEEHLSHHDPSDDPWEEPAQISVYLVTICARGQPDEYLGYIHEWIRQVPRCR